MEMVYWNGRLLSPLPKNTNISIILVLHCRCWSATDHVVCRLCRPARPPTLSEETHAQAPAGRRVRGDWWQGVVRPNSWIPEGL